ncbi:PREDICTED: DENN domain-containing protein 2C isoform X1 [Sturnus vulgaris]|uniref:DENN domain-containing protein 2C isoform X1 n=1 Tax=Sturnus vulgaris TaxID=9172 RepID=UPI00071A4C8E|nr:PREDICTED: DENN domain-containing protein 2C isoform X1 [Sturnus vulgaris]XP_014728266.1 PREDICTED: DENN domain-containing protein 2C isoform X1 [Sturnus vulgaris]
MCAQTAPVGSELWKPVLSTWSEQPARTPLCDTLECGVSLDVCRTREDVSRAGHGLCVSTLAPAMHPTGAGDSSFSRATGLTLSRSHCRNIRQKISQWEGRTRGCSKDRQQPRDFGVKYDPSCNALPRVKAECTENGRKAGPKDPKSLGLDFREDARSCWQSGDCGGPASRAKQKGEGQTLAPGVALPPGNFYTSQALWSRADPLLPGRTCPAPLDPQRKRGRSGSTERELQVKGVNTLCRAERSLRNIYSEVEGQEEEPAPDPPPKPRRTFRYLAEKGAGGRRDASATREAPLQKQCGKDLVSSSNSPEKKIVSRRIRGRAQRKSFEFEDIQGFRKRPAASSSHRPREETNGTAGSRLAHTQSEDNIYEDIICPTKENPYEDIRPLPLWKVPSVWKLPPPRSISRAPKPPPKPLFLSRKSLELKPSQTSFQGKMGKETSLPVTLSEWKLFRAVEAASRRKNLPWLVLKIQEIFDSKRGKKKVKLLSPAAREAAPVKGETSGNESDTENQPKSHHRCPRHSASKRNPHYQTLERDLIELQEQRLFELFVVVSLHKKASEVTYTPHIIQQFPSKPEHPFRPSKDTEERLKVIPKFCFPDPKDWFPSSDLKSETFSFVLTGEDGSRWFGYCRKLLPEGKGKRLPEVYCIVSRLGCFNLFSKILDEVEKRREMSPALVHPFMRSVMEAPFPAPGRTITVRSFLPGAGDEVMELCRPLDSRLEHVDFECLLQCLSVSHTIRVFASLLLERRVIFVADNLSTLSKCGHAAVATLYPFTWQHTYIPVLPASMIDIVCSPTPFLIGILSCSLPQLQDLPIEEVLIVDLCADKFLQEVSDEDEILPHKLQAALEQILEERSEILSHGQSDTQGDTSLNSLVSEAFVQFFVEIVGHYSLHMSVTERGERVFQREPFRKSHGSRTVRHFLHCFMETQMFAGFIQDRELSKNLGKGLFEVRAMEYLERIPETERTGMNKILRSLGKGTPLGFVHC